MKNITLSAPEEVIEKARQKARRSGKTLNAVFREWLTAFASSKDQVYKDQVQTYSGLLDSTKTVVGRNFT